MKIKELYSSGVKENGKFDLTFITDADKQYNLINCECVGHECYDDFDDEHEFNMKFTYGYKK